MKTFHDLEQERPWSYSAPPHTLKCNSWSTEHRQSTIQYTPVKRAIVTLIGGESTRNRISVPTRLCSRRTCLSSAQTKVYAVKSHYCRSNTETTMSCFSNPGPSNQLAYFNASVYFKNSTPSSEFLLSQSEQKLTSTAATSIPSILFNRHQAALEEFELFWEK